MEGITDIESVVPYNGVRESDVKGKLKRMFNGPNALCNIIETRAGRLPIFASKTILEVRSIFNVFVILNLLW